MRQCFPRARRCSSADGNWPASTRCTPGEPVTFTYTPPAAVPGLGHHAGLQGTEQLSSEPDGDPYPAERASRRSPTGSTATPLSCRRTSQPAVRQCSAQQRAGSAVLANGPGDEQALCDRLGIATSNSVSRPSIFSTGRISAPPNGNRSSGGVRHDHVDIRSAAVTARLQAQFLIMR